MHSALCKYWQNQHMYGSTGVLRHTRYTKWRGIYFSVFFFFFSAFGFLASWLLGFLASWLLGFLPSWLLVFSACWLLGFWASGLFGFLGFSAFCWFMRLLVAFGFSHPLHSQFLFGWRFGFCGFWWLLAALAFRILRAFLAFAPFHWFLDLASRIISITTTLFESSLLRTSWGGTPPTHPLLFRLFAE